MHTNILVNQDGRVENESEVQPLWDMASRHLRRQQPGEKQEADASLKIWDRDDRKTRNFREAEEMEQESTGAKSGS